MHISLFGLLAVMAVGQNAGTSIRDELAVYYRTGKQPENWTKSIEKLASANAEERRQTATRLVELMAQAREDEASGKAPWHATPFWGGGAENPARDLRRQIAMALDKAPAQPELL